MQTSTAHKRLVGEYWATLNGTNRDRCTEIVDAYHTPDAIWYGPHPFDRVEGHAAQVEGVWRPFFEAFPDAVREPYILMGGEFQGRHWVSGTGYFRATFAADWLGIPATGSETTIRFGEFCRLQDDRIAEVRVIFDIPDVMRQASVDPFPPSPGVPGRVPGPTAGDGVRLGDVTDDTAAESRTRSSLELVEAMIAGLSRYDGSGDVTTMEQERFWTRDMLWYGPHGIGATHGLTGFQDDHQRPFLTAFPDRKGGNHVCRHGDGHYVASTGWPSVRATHLGPYLGAEATGRTIGMRVMDWWRVEGDRLGENWVFIDLPDLFRQFGIDLLETVGTKHRSREGGVGG